jgi:hypothetical protein
MNTIRAVFRIGRVELDEPIDWPEGTELEVSLRHTATNTSADNMDNWKAEETQETLRIQAIE